jgi:hypothetical protein
LNLGHLYFDIVSTVRCPVENFMLRISYFASLHILMPAIPESKHVRILTYEIIKLFLQNEPKFRKSQMNVNKVLTKDYVQMDTWSNGKNEPKRTQTNPNKPNFSRSIDQKNVFIMEKNVTAGPAGHLAVIFLLNRYIPGVIVICV